MYLNSQVTGFHTGQRHKLRWLEYFEVVIKVNLKISWGRMGPPGLSFDLEKQDNNQFKYAAAMENPCMCH